MPVSIHMMAKMSKTDNTKCKQTLQSSWNPQTLLIGTENGKPSVAMSYKIKYTFSFAKQLFYSRASTPSHPPLN